MKVLFGSLNKGKWKEVAGLASAADAHVIFPGDLASENKISPPDVEETADTYVGNAKLKAEAFSAWAGTSAFADDAGLEVDGLDGAPGVFTARFAGPEANSAANRAKMIGLLKEGIDPKARFVSVIYLKNLDGEDVIVRGELPGTLIPEERGDGGFGYAPIFVPDGYQETLAELMSGGKYFETHRAKSMQKLFAELANR